MSERAAVSSVPVSKRLGVTLSLLTQVALIAAAVSSSAGKATAAQDPPPPVVPPPVATPVQDPAQPPPPAEAPAETPAPPPAPATTLQVRVRDASTGVVVPRAIVRLESETERTRSRNADDQGLAVFNRLTEGTYNVIVQGIGLQTYTLNNVRVTAGQTTNVEVQLLVRREETAFKFVRELIDTRDTTISTIRDQAFFQAFPLNAGNSQDLSRLLLSVPGVARDVMYRNVLRGEENVNRTVLLDGFLAPRTPQGSAISMYQPNTLNGFRAVTGGFSPRYGGGSGLILDADVREPTARLGGRPELELSGRVGAFGTVETNVGFGARVRSAFSRRGPTYQPGERGLGYFLQINARNTDNALETPQATNQTRRNQTETTQFFGKFDFQLTRAAVLKATFSLNRGETQIANRLGLPDEYAPFGQGFGFGGSQPASSGLPSQDAAGQRLLQREDDDLVFFQIDRQMRNGGTLLLGFGASSDRFRLDNAPRPTTGTFPADSSVEFDPTVRNSYDQLQAQIDYTGKLTKTNHQLAFGAVVQSLSGDEKYQYIPGSQRALDFLSQIDTRLLPTTRNGQTFTPFVFVDRDGSYAAAYVQDTFRPRTNLTVNYGIRADTFTQKMKSRGVNIGAGTEFRRSSISRTDTGISPRVNAALSFVQGGGQRVGFPLFRRIYRFLSSQPTVARFAYNRLFAPPNLGQGDYLFGGSSPVGLPSRTVVQAQTTDQIDLSLERQLKGSKVVRFGIYSKNIKDYLQAQQLIPGLQTGMLAMLNQGDVTVSGYEISLDLLPPREDGYGFRGFLVYNGSKSKAKGGQNNNLGQSIGATIGGNTVIPDTAQNNTMTLGASFKAPTGALVGLSLYHGSGLYSSAERTFLTPVRSGGRESYNELNLRIASGPRLLKNKASLQLDVENLTDSKARLSYIGSYAGTRFQQGRRALLTLSARF